MELVGSLLSASSAKSGAGGGAPGLSGEMLRSMRYSGVIGALFAALRLLDLDHPNVSIIFHDPLFKYSPGVHELRLPGRDRRALCRAAPARLGPPQRERYTFQGTPRHLQGDVASLLAPGAVCMLVLTRSHRYIPETASPLQGANRTEPRCTDDSVQGRAFGCW